MGKSAEDYYREIGRIAENAKTKITFSELAELLGLEDHPLAIGQRVAAAERFFSSTGNHHDAKIAGMIQNTFVGKDGNRRF